jgi:ABC-type polysaccharide/polyol phosphate export permease
MLKEASLPIRHSVVPPRGLGKYAAEIREHRNILYQLVRQQITLRYRRTFLGYLWTLLNPLLMMSVTAVVFSAIFRMDLKTYAIFLFSGVIAFNLFATIVTQSGQSLIGNEQLIKKIYIPKILFPLAVSIALLIDSVLMFASLFLIILAIGGNISLPLLGILPAYIVLLAFAAGVGLVFSIMAVYFRDLQHIIGMQALIFLSPVYYKPDSLSGKVEWAIRLNPLTHFIDLFRAPIYQGTLPAPSSVLFALLYATVSLAFGLWFFRRHEKRVAFRM